MDGATEIRLTEYEKRIDERCDRCQKSVDDKFEAKEKALELQAKEYDRRLKDLNNEQKRVGAWEAKCVPREVYERDRKELENKIATANKITLAIIGLGFTAIATIIVVLNY